VKATLDQEVFVG